MYKKRLKDCFVILGIAHRAIDDSEIKEQIKEVAITYKGIVTSNKKLTKKRIEKIENYIDTLGSLNEKVILKKGQELLGGV